MIVTVSRTITWTVTESFKSQDFIIPDSMSSSSNDEIIKFLEESDQLADADWDLVKDNWSNSQYEFFIEDKDIPFDEGIPYEIED